MGVLCPELHLFYRMALIFFEGVAKGGGVRF